MSFAFGILFYFPVLLFLLYRATRKKTVPLTPVELTLAFGFKVLMGCLYGYIFLHYFGGDDTWLYHREGLEELEKWSNDIAAVTWNLAPGYFFEHADGFMQGIRFYLDNLEKTSSIKVLALFDILSGKNYYINVVLFNFIIFWGHYLLFTVLVSRFPEKRKIIFFFVFLFPPVVFWLSGIRVDAWVFLFIALLVKTFDSWLQSRKAGKFIGVVLSFLALLIFRNVVAFICLPALLAWYFAASRRNPFVAFALTYGAGILLFFATGLLPGNMNLPAFVANRQQEYLALEANTRFKLDALEPTVNGFFKVTPQALLNTFLRPFPWEAKGALQLMAAADIIFFLLLLGLFVFRKEKPTRAYLSQPILLFFLFTGVSLFLFIGYTVPFPGAIVRYKIIGELFLLLLLSLNIRLGNNRLYK